MNEQVQLLNLSCLEGRPGHGRVLRTEGVLGKSEGGSLRTSFIRLAFLTASFSALAAWHSGLAGGVT